MITAVGIGNQFHPLIGSQPKEIIPIVYKRSIHHVVEEAVNSGLDEILILVGAGKDSIINYFSKHALDDSLDDYGFRDLPDIYFVRQEEQRELADAARYAGHFTEDENFVVLLVDTFYKPGINKTVTSQMLDVYGTAGIPLIAEEKVSPESVSYCGIVDSVKIEDNPLRVKGVVEKPETETSPSDLRLTGIYVLGTYVYDYLSQKQAGKNSELQLSDVYNAVIKDTDVYARRINGKRYNIGTMELWIKKFVEFATKDGRMR